MAGLCEGGNEPPGSLKAICNGRQHSLKCVKGKRSRPMCPVVQQEEVESISASRYECTIVQCVLRGEVTSSPGAARAKPDKDYRMKPLPPLELPVSSRMLCALVLPGPLLPLAANPEFPGAAKFAAVCQ
ncbi:hypothetical protein ANN_19123 [Periplaneta americana]|uniref:Uncharacterized protein n=1 Tax=Periplaneta americana TaxID=6978 RepID=A0ABQ8S9P0_PERAM|nr:hypothetical protein ANN_19123 [Periplaneta americana]